ncbi:sigma-54-dependent transcriptional regulator [Sandaracinus amylolyticus]|uniref:Response regulator of zinc sigma-54-dependent two-component system n=1 Tax=Sandaracinus amylolyticus TaxID=927083 RepID=A0A0F6W1Q8_9BACT|nr:sigma-54 dependent transcriptional regulator [Sandaracinus amylolyticus]AKF05027.1 Response regulator of zinc sigma-54-dependent two-component system [Sandaracinus amylolyticus]
MSKARVLVVDDDRAVGLVLASLLKQAGYESHHVASGEDALAALASRAIDVVISDVRMPGMDGMELLGEVKQRTPDVPVLLLTAHGSVPLAVEAMKAGAAEFLLKPFDRDEVLFTVEKALATNARVAARPPDAPVRGEGQVLGDSDAMRETIARLKKAAPTVATVLLRGESGTGKEVAARTLHGWSPRHAGPFVAVHCAALPDNLLESELFGYEKGAFTGATQRKPGRVELAQGGTLFLDEIGDISPAVQVKLLRLLQEKEFQRLGGTSAEKVDVRFVAATHRDLEAMVEDGTFREDLFYRLNVVPVWMPPLRERGDDVALLANRFCAELADQNGRAGLRFAADGIAALRAHDWPGNVRELQNLVERLVVFAEGDAIRASDVERELGARSARNGRPSGSPAPIDAGTLDAHRVEAEKGAIRDALARAQGNRTQAARLLGISRRTLYNKLAELGLE